MSGGKRRHKKKIVWRPKPKVLRPWRPPKNPNVRFVCTSEPTHVFDFKIKKEDVEKARFHCPHDGLECERHEIRAVHS